MTVLTSEQTEPHLGRNRQRNIFLKVTEPSLPELARTVSVPPLHSGEMGVGRKAIRPRPPHLIP